MNKQEALKKINLLEKELNELKDIVNKPDDLFNTIKTYDDVCRALGENKIIFDNFNNINDITLLNKLVAFTRLKQIEKLFNGNWKIDWDNNNQKKYYCWFENKKSGWVFYFSYDIRSYSCGQVAYFKDKETSDYVGKTFKDLFITLIS